MRVWRFISRLDRVSKIQTTVVGSYPVPAWLLGRGSDLALRDAMMVVLKTQELAGLDLITDGELNRFDPAHPDTNGMIDYFVSKMSGIQTRLSRSDLERFRSDPQLSYRSRPAGIVAGPIGEGTLDLRGDFERIRGLTRSPLKFTCTGPHMLAKVLTNWHFPDQADLAMEIAKILREQLTYLDASVVQLDEANISGHPEDSEWAAQAINHVLDGIGVEKGVHICFGNYGGQTVQKGFWRDLLPFLNSLRTDHLILEFARRGYAELEDLRDLDPRIALGIGVIDIKDNEVETADTVASRIEQIVTVLGQDRLKYIHPDCGFWMLTRSVTDRKMWALVEGRDLFEEKQ